MTEIENGSILKKLGAIFEDVVGGFGKKGEKESIIGIDIGSSFIKVVQIRNKKGKAILETYGEIALGPYGQKEFGQATQLPPEVISQAISDLFKEAQVTTKDAAISIPLRASLLSLMEVPYLKSKKDFEAMIPIEARKYIPVPISEVTVDWWVVPRVEKDEIPEGAHFDAGGDKIAKEEGVKKTQMVEIMVVAIHNDIIERYQNIISSLGLQSVFFELEVFSAVRSTFGKGMAPVLFIDIGAGATKIAIIEYGIVKFSHTINRGSQDISVSISTSLSQSFGKAEELKRKYGLLGQAGTEDKNADIVGEISRVSLESIFSEINESLMNYQRRHSVSIGQTIITGGGALLKGLPEFAKEKLKIEVSLGNAFGRIETPAFLDQSLAEAGPEFAVSVGLALRKLQEKS